MNYIAFYLPQYHIIPENNLWWGEGFTEWVRVKNSTPLFDGHNQPRIPLSYYDLSNGEIMIEQSLIAKRYGIYGFCYYHYWFNGKLLLEKPIENMLACKNVDIPFCLSWANEKWTRAWEGKSKEILIDQDYGNEKEWREHLDYLIPFFKDERYIRINGKPVFLIYRTESFSGFDRMIRFWSDIMVERGFKGLYIIEMLNSYQKLPCCKNSSGVIEFEPMFTVGDTFSLKAVLKSYLEKGFSAFLKKQYKKFDYDKVWQNIIQRKTSYHGKALFNGAFTDWDNTPRFKDRSTIFKNVTPEKFQYYLRKLKEKSTQEFIFINAWNEWAEGAYLEPDRRNGTKFLESVKNSNL